MNKIIYLDYLRSVAIIAVVGIHITAPSVSMTIEDVGWQINVAYNAIFRMGVPLFFMISGALFLDPGRSMTGQYLFKKIVRILMVFTVFSLGYNLLYYISKYGLYFNQEAFVDKFLPNLIGGWYHLWFLQALLALYILTPILRMIARNERVAGYYCCLLFVICSLLPFINALWDSQKYTSNLIENFSMSLPQYTLYFVLGYLLNITKNKFNLSILVAGSILVIILMIAGDIVFAMQSSNIKIFFSSYLSPLTVIYTSFLFLLCKQLFGSRFSSSKIVVLLSSYSFGIYLIHDLFLIVAREIGIIPFGQYSLIEIPIFIVLVLLFSVLSTFIMKVIPGLKIML